jgi:prevent-host-death family protein
MVEVSVSEAKTQLSRLLERVRAGEEVVILKSGKPYARLVPPAERRERVPGLLAGGPVDDAFFDELPESELQAWE